MRALYADLPATLLSLTTGTETSGSPVSPIMATILGSNQSKASNRSTIRLSMAIKRPASGGVPQRICKNLLYMREVRSLVNDSYLPHLPAKTAEAPVFL